jgi:hypothetical protein
MANTKRNAQGQDGGANPTPLGGGVPSSPSENRSGDTSQTPPDPPGNEDTNALGQDGGKVKIFHARNVKIFLSDGSIAEFNSEGIAEIEETEAARLLSIPGYKKV